MEVNELSSVSVGQYKEKAVTGLFHKGAVKEQKYDLHESMVNEIQRMEKQNGVPDTKAKFKQCLNEMRNNKHFKEFFLFHEEALRTGLERMNREAGQFKTINFAEAFMEHLEQQNTYRKYNKEAFIEMKCKTSNQKSIEQIASQKK